jgi:hypothetical protein
LHFVVIPDATVFRVLRIVMDRDLNGRCIRRSTPCRQWATSFIRHCVTANHPSPRKKLVPLPKPEFSADCRHVQFQAFLAGSRPRWTGRYLQAGLSTIGWLSIPGILSSSSGLTRLRHIPASGAILPQLFNLIHRLAVNSSRTRTKSNTRFA